MDSIYKFNEELDIPIYKQLVDSIRLAIKNGTLPAGHQLPTVCEMTEELGIARGTVKRVYDELELANLVEKVQGRGTFVRYQPANSASRKEQAMAAIDTMLDSLEDMGLSTTEINIFLSLKLRERSEEEAHIKVAVVECNPENLSQISEQLRHIDGIDLYSFTIDSIKQYPYKLGDDFELIATTALHYDYLQGIVLNKKKLACVALRPSARCLSHIIKLKKDKKTGIVGYSERFSQLLYDTCSSYNDEVVLFEPINSETAKGVKNYLEDKDAVLVPKFYEKYFSSDASSVIRKFGGEIIECNYELDEGSVLYLEAKIKRLLEDKML